MLSRQQSQIRSDAIVDRADGDIRTTDGGCGIPIHTHCAVPEQCKACARHDILKAWKEQRRCSRIYYPCISRAMVERVHLDAIREPSNQCTRQLQPVPLFHRIVANQLRYASNPRQSCGPEHATSLEPTAILWARARYVLRRNAHSV